MIFLGFLLVIIITALTILLANAPLEAFWDLRAFGIVAAGIMFHFAWFGRVYFLPGVKTIFRLPRPELGETDPKLGQYYWRLTGFTLGYATLVAFVAVMILLVDFDPDNLLGMLLAIGLLAPFYAILIALAIFLPISLRHLPDNVNTKRFPISFTLTGFAVYFLTRAMMVILFIALVILPEPLQIKDVGTILNQIFFKLFPTDLAFVGDEDYGYNLSMFVQTSGMVMLGVLLWGFRISAGRIHNRWTWTPVCILYGVLGTIMGMIIMLGDMDPVTYSAGCYVALLSAFYGILAAIFFAIGNWRVPVLLFLGLFIFVFLQALFLFIPQNPVAGPGPYLIVSAWLITFSLLFLYILRGGIRKMRVSRIAAVQSPEPLTPEEKQAQQILDKAIEEEKMRNK